MSNATDSIKPKIDDGYWFTLSETLISKASENREQAASRLQNLIIWLWGIYTASATVGFALSGKALSFWPTVLIAGASASLIAVYWSTVWVQMPILCEFDPRSPTEIKEAYKHGAVAKDHRLKLTIFLSVLAAFMVSLALITASVSKEQKPTVPPFIVSLHPKADKRILSITALVGPTKTVTVHVHPLTPTSTGLSNDDCNFMFMPTGEGLLQTSIPLNTNAEQLEVTLDWEDATGMRTRISKNVREDSHLEHPT